MTTHIQNNSIELYLRKIEQLFPYSKKRRREALDYLKQDVKDAMKNSKETDPIEVFGLPRDVAKSFSLNYNWETMPSGFITRAAAYIIDVFLSFVLFFLLYQRIEPFLSYHNYIEPILPIIPRLLQDFLLLIPVWMLSFYHVIILEGLFSTTVGKKIFGLVVCDLSGIRITWQQAATRNLSKILPGLIVFEIISGNYFSDRKEQRILDMIAETIVVTMRKDLAKTGHLNSYQTETRSNQILYQTEISNHISDQTRNYLLKIERLLPYPKEKRTEAIENLRVDVEEFIKDSGKTDPLEAFGSPRDVAKNYCENYEWTTTRASVGTRSMAYFIDTIISLVFFFLGYQIIAIIARLYQFGLIEPLVENFSFLSWENQLLVVLFYGPFIIITFALWWIICLGHPLIFEGIFSTTIGKRILGLVVCDISGIRITWNQAIIRNSTKLLLGTIVFEIVATLVSQNVDDQRRILDIVAETVVMKNFQRLNFAKILLILLSSLLILYYATIFLDTINNILFSWLM